MKRKYTWIDILKKLMRQGGFFPKTRPKFMHTGSFYHQVIVSSVQMCHLHLIVKESGHDLGIDIRGQRENDIKKLV